MQSGSKESTNKADSSNEPIRLDRNENHYGPAPGCLELLRTLDPELLLNYTRDFTQGYYSVLSKRLAELHKVDEKQIILGYGCEDVLKQAVHHWLRPGEHCFVPTASWWYYHQIANEVDGVTVEFPVVEGPESYEFDVDALIQMGRKRHPRVLLIASPNNPTGNIFPADRIIETLDCFPDTYVIIDQAYFGLGDEPTVDDSSALIERYPNLLILRSFSKLMALAGVRIGYGVAGARMDTLLTFSARYLGYNRLSEQIALAALDDPEYYEGLRQKIAADRARFHELLSSYEGVRVYRSLTNFLLVRFPEHLIAPLRSGLEARGLFIKFLSEPAFRNCARISLGTEQENSLLLDAFRQLLPAA